MRKTRPKTKPSGVLLAARQHFSTFGASRPIAALLVLILVVLLVTHAASGPNQLTDAYIQSANPTRNNSVVLPISSNLHTDQQAVVIDGLTKLYERYEPKKANYAIYVATGTSLATLGSPSAAILPGQMQTTPVDGIGCWGIYAPSVMVDPTDSTHVSMVFEADPHSGPAQSGYCPWEPKTTNQYIGMADSTDRGVTWSHFRRLIDIPKGSTGANVGTPAIIYLPNLREIGIYYHQNPGSNQALVPHMRTYPTTTPSTMTYNSQFSDRIISMTLGGQPLTNSWSSGVGRADITYWQNGASGTSDGYYYMIMEAFNGSAQCLVSGGTNKDKILIARSRTITGPFAVIDPGWTPVNLVTCAGPDMPTWFVDAQKNYHIISTDDIRDSSGADHFRLQRWDLH